MTDDELDRAEFAALVEMQQTAATFGSSAILPEFGRAWIAWIIGATARRYGDKGLRNMMTEATEILRRRG